MALEGAVLDGLDLNSAAGALTLEAIDFPVPKKRYEWADNADIDGSLLIRDPLHDNRTIPMTIRVRPQTTMDNALAALASITKKLEECERNPDGLPFVCTPPGSAKTITFDVLSGEIDGLPRQVTGDVAGWFLTKPAPQISLTLTAKPFGRGADVTGGAVSSTSPMLLVLLGEQVTNSGFEVDTSGWANSGGFIGGGATISRVTAQHNSGVAAMQVVTTATAFGGAQFTMGGTFLLGVTYTATCWMKGNAGGESVQFAFGVSGDVVQTNVVLTTAWQQVSVSWVPAANRTGVSVAAQNHTAAAITFFVDDVSCQQNLVGGDVPALGRLQIAEPSGNSRRYVEWGLEQRYFDPLQSLLIDSEDLVTSGFSGAQTVLAGGYRRAAATHDVVQGAITGTATAVCGTGVLGHVGTFRVKCRVNDASTNLNPAIVRARFVWQDGDGPFRANTWQTPVANSGQYEELDLGLVQISPTQLGTQKWSGRIEAYTTDGSAQLFNVDYLVLVPAAEGYGRARAAWTYQPPITIPARDSFATGGALNTRAADAGGAWATAGAATDFAAAGGAYTRATNVVEATLPGRSAVLGSTTFTDQEVGVQFADSVIGGSGSHYVLLRWTNATNFAYVQYSSAAGGNALVLTTVVAGVSTTVFTPALVTTTVGTFYTLRGIAYASGLFIGQLLSGTTVLLSGYMTSSALATGGALASGLPGFADQSGSVTANTRTYDNFYCGVPGAEPIVLWANRLMEVRYDGAIRQDSTGAYWGPVPAYRGSRFLIPPAGDKSRTARLLVKADRNDIEIATDAPLADNLTVNVTYTPRFLEIPF